MIDSKPLRSETGELLPFDHSVGYQVRITHRALQRYLQQHIEPHGVTPGMWYFLRALWHEDGLTQRELSDIVGTMEPTTLTAIRSMEKNGLVTRTRSEQDRRKINIHLTPRGQALRGELLPLARKVVDDAVEGFSEEERKQLMQFLNRIQKNLHRRIDERTLSEDV